MSLVGHKVLTCPFKSLNDGSSDWWTASGSEYEYNQSDVTIKPLNVQESGSDMTPGTFGSLAIGEWAWDNSTGKLHIRTSGDVDPDTLSADTIKCSEPIEVYTANASPDETINIGIKIANNEAQAVDADIVLYTDDGTDPTYIEMFTIEGTDRPATESIKGIMAFEERLMILTNKELVSVWVSENEG